MNSENIVSIDFDIGHSEILSDCPDCLYHKLGKRKYKRLMYLVACILCNLADYYEFKEVNYVKSRKSKKKS